jgi:hypothetical protein
MDITWKQTSEGEVITPYKKDPIPYQIFQTQILEQKIPINVVQSEETRRIIVAKKEGEKYIPARLHLGMPRVIDLCTATYTLASSKEFKDAINHKYIPEKEGLSAMLIREPIPQSPFINSYLGSGFESRLYAVMDVHHVEDESGVKGLAGRVCKYRIDIPESKSKEIHNDIKICILYDSIAGGRNLKAATKHLKERFENLEKVVYVSVYAAYQGCKRLADFCVENDLECEFFCMHELLNASPINEYDCFYPDWNICKEDRDILKGFYGEKHNQIGMGGDWTANALGREQAEDVFRSQLKDLNIDTKGKFKKQPHA